MKKSLLRLVTPILLLPLLFTSCGQEKTVIFDMALSEDHPENNTFAANIEEPESAVAVDYGDFDGTLICLDSTRSNAFGEGVAVDGNTVTVNKAGTYQVTGTLNGCLYVDTEEDEEVLLLLNGVKITGDEHCAINILSAPKRVTLRLVEGSVNIVEDAQNAANEEEQVEYDACIYSKEDLRIEGDGTLFVTSHTAKGIRTKDGLEIFGGKICVTAAQDGIKGKDSICIRGGEIAVTAGGDAIQTTGADENSPGTVTVSGGKLTLDAGDDGIDATGNVKIFGGDISVVTGDGAASGTPAGKESFPDGFGPGEPGKEDFDPGNFDPGGFGPGDFNPGDFDPGEPRKGGFDPGGKRRDDGRFVPGGDQNKDSTDPACKGIKSNSEIIIDGGTLKADCSDDALHAADGIRILSGSLILSSGDDGIHCDKTVEISGGDISILRSYEGVEGQYITVSGGNISIVSSDDGFNATDGSAAGGFNGKRGFGGANEDCLLCFTGGYTVVNADGDGLDSNGNIEQSGGTVIVFGPSDNGNGAIDYGDGADNLYSFSGGTLLAVGSSGMMQTVSGTVPSIAVKTNNLSASVAVYALDEAGNCVFAFETPKKISSIVFASDKLSPGTLFIYTGGVLPALTDHTAFFPTDTPSGGTLLKSVAAK